MDTCNKPNLKRFREILLKDQYSEDDNIEDYSDFESDSDSEYELPTDIDESDDTSTDEHISEQVDSSDSDINDDNNMVNTQPKTIQKGELIWSSDPSSIRSRTPAAMIMKKKPGCTAKVQNILDAFKLFFTDEILDIIVNHTNRYAKQCFERNKNKQKFSKTKTKYHEWQPIDRIELESFIGLLLQSGVTHSNHELLSDLWNISENCPLYRATMSLQRFKYILQFLRFDDRQHRDSSDRLSPIKVIFELFVKQLPKHFIPGENLTADEQLVSFRGRCAFVQYMPQKPAKYGLKFWALCDADSRYILSVDLYTGKKDNVIQRNLSLNVVLNLVDRLPDIIKKGRCITVDRYFTDIKLCEALLDRKMTLIGVVGHQRSFVPNEIKQCRKELYSTWFYFSGPYMILSYQAKERKKPVILLSSLHNCPETYDDTKQLPCAVHDYNQTKCGVDLIDQCINFYTVRRSIRRWPMVAFFNMIDIAAINSMTIWLCQKHNEQRKSDVRRTFLKQLSKSLTDAQDNRRSQQVRLMPKVKLALLSLGYHINSESIKNIDPNIRHPTKRRCYLCPSHPGRKVRQMCSTCGQHVCLSHSSSVTTVTCHTCTGNN